MTKRLVITVEDDTVELQVEKDFQYDHARELVASMVKRALGFDEYENSVYVNVKVYEYD